MRLATENRLPQVQYQKQQRPLAPATMSRDFNAAQYKKPTNAYFLGTTLDSNNPAVVRRNARERNRVKQVNNGFSNLRQHIPAAIVADLSNGRRGIGPGAQKKLSKVDTLRMAVEYIRRLKNVIDDVDNSDSSSVSSFNSCASSTSSSPPPPLSKQAESANAMAYNYFPTQSTQYYGLSYTGSFQQQPQHTTMISPTDSTTSSTYNYSFDSNSPSSQAQMDASLQLKFEQPIDDYTNNSADDDELLDYISLWQHDL